MIKAGPCTPGALAWAVAHSDSDIQSDIERLELFGFVERDNAGDLAI